MSGPTQTTPQPQPRAAGPRRPGSVLPRRLPLLLLGAVSLLAGLWGGLLLLGLSVPTVRADTATDHGVLMTLGFLGTVIALERAVALRRGWAYIAPAAAGLGGLALLSGLPETVGWSLLCLASVVFVLVYVAVLRIQPILHLKVMFAGAVCWYVATVLWFGGFAVPRLVPWVAGFLVLTVLGERLELARVALLSPNSVRYFTAAATTFAAGLVLSATTGAGITAGTRLAGVGLIGLALWGAKYDVARRTVKIPGVTRFMAVCLLAGYVWLLSAGVIWAIAGDLGHSLALYDAALHALFLGFIMSMIFGHAPVIVPAVLGIRLPFAPWFYPHVALLHASLLIRLVAGDALGSTVAWQVGGVGTELTIMLFLVVSVVAALRGRDRARS